MTTPLLRKLNHKDHQEIIIINAPEEFRIEMDAMKKSGNNITALTSRDITKLKVIEFILSFVQTKNEVEKISAAIEKKLVGDALVWFAYPKGTSQKYKAEINRDNGWELLGEKGFETVRSVAIDTDWTGLRFRQVEFIKTMKRNVSFAMTKKGKARIDKK